MFNLLFSALFQVLQRLRVPSYRTDLRTRTEGSTPSPWMICLWKKNRTLAHKAGPLRWGGEGVDLLTPPPKPFAPQLAPAARLFSSWKAAWTITEHFLSFNLIIERCFFFSSTQFFLQIADCKRREKRCDKRKRRHWSVSCCCQSNLLRLLLPSSAFSLLFFFIVFEGNDRNQVAVLQDEQIFSFHFLQRLVGV